MFPDEFAKKKGPRTDLDKKFLLIVEQAMSKRGIQSDRAMSIELDRHPNFMNRVRNGLQSAPPDAWETLRAKFPTTVESIDAITNYIATVGTGQAVGINHGTISQEIDHYEPKRREGTPYYEWHNFLFVSAETYDAMKREIELLEGQLGDKERIIKLLEQNLTK